MTMPDTGSFLAEPRLQNLARDRRQHGEAAIGIERNVRREHMDVRVVVNGVAEGLHEQDETRPRAGPGA